MLRSYDKSGDISYSLGAFPTVELIRHRPSDIESVVLRSDLRMTDELEEILAPVRDKTVTDEFLEELKTLSAQSARKILLTVKGVGPKVADCIVLFGLGKRDSFPVDTWMKKALGSEELNTADKIHDFYLRRYGSLAGLAQQYIYNHARTRGQGSGS